MRFMNDPSGGKSSKIVRFMNDPRIRIDLIDVHQQERRPDLQNLNDGNNKHVNTNKNICNGPSSPFTPFTPEKVSQDMKFFPIHGTIGAERKTICDERKTNYKSWLGHMSPKMKTNKTNKIIENKTNLRKKSDGLRKDMRNERIMRNGDISMSFPSEEGSRPARHQASIEKYFSRT